MIIEEFSGQGIPLGEPRRAPDYADRIAERIINKVAFDEANYPINWLAVVASAAREGYALGYSVPR